MDRGRQSVREPDESGRKVIAGHALAEFARSNAGRVPPDPLSVGSSARNRFVGLVTKVVTDKVMAQVEMQCGPFTVVSLMSADAVRELQLEPGSVAVAVVKATTVIVETPRTDHEALLGLALTGVVAVGFRERLRIRQANRRPPRLAGTAEGAASSRSSRQHH